MSQYLQYFWAQQAMLSEEIDFLTGRHLRVITPAQTQRLLYLFTNLLDDFKFDAATRDRIFRFLGVIPLDTFMSLGLLRVEIYNHLHGLVRHADEIKRYFSSGSRNADIVEGYFLREADVLASRQDMIRARQVLASISDRYGQHQRLQPDIQTLMTDVEEADCAICRGHHSQSDDDPDNFLVVTLMGDIASQIGSKNTETVPTAAVTSPQS